MNTLAELQTSVTEWHYRDAEDQVEGRIVPFGESAVVVEDGERFTEVFDAGSLTFMCQVAASRGNAAWISFVLDHDERLDSRIGWARSLEQRDDGAWATFQLYRNNRDLAKVRDMLHESHTGLSVLFRDRVPAIEVDGVRHRRQVVVDHVSATPMPTYSGAQIMAIRSQPEELLGGTPKLDEWQTWLAAQT
jgi:hypothetical protein